MMAFENGFCQVIKVTRTIFTVVLLPVLSPFIRPIADDMGRVAVETTDHTVGPTQLLNDLVALGLIDKVINIQ